MASYIYRELRGNSFSYDHLVTIWSHRVWLCIFTYFRVSHTQNTAGLDDKRLAVTTIFRVCPKPPIQNLEVESAFLTSLLHYSGRVRDLLAKPPDMFRFESRRDAMRCDGSCALNHWSKHIRIYLKGKMFRPKRCLLEQCLWLIRRTESMFGGAKWDIGIFTIYGSVCFIYDSHENGNDFFIHINLKLISSKWEI